MERVKNFGRPVTVLMSRLMLVAVTMILIGGGIIANSSDVYADDRDKGTYTIDIGAVEKDAFNTDDGDSVEILYNTLRILLYNEMI